MVDDPTSAPEVVSLRQKILAKPEVASYIDTLKSKRLGLVLSGGGKGAYEAGVLLALLDCGIQKYCALSGTSVGALNAALCHESCRTGNRNIVIKVWGRMSWTKVLTVHPIRLLTVIMARLLLVPGSGVALFMWWLHRVEAGVRFKIRFGGHRVVPFISYGLSRLVGYIFGYIFVVGSMAFGYAFAAGHVDQVTILGLLVAISVLAALASPFVARYLAFVSNAPLRTAATSSIDATKVVEE